MHRIESADIAGRWRRGFTLVELLVVIAIIGVLIALLIPVIGVARASVQESTITTEVASLSQSLEAFRTQYQVDYPPDFSLMNPITVPQNDVSDVANTLSRLFRYRMGDDLPLNSRGDPDASLFLNLDPAEALFFWLRGFSDNPKYPLYGRTIPERKAWLNTFPANEREQALLLEFQNVPTTPLFEFDKLRLRDDDKDGFPEFYPRFGKQVPYVYFVHTRYAQAALNQQLTIRMGPDSSFMLRDDVGVGNPQFFPPRPYFRLPDVQNTPKLIPPGELNWAFAAPDKYQIICAGLDGVFGPSVDWYAVDQMSQFFYFFPLGPYVDIDPARRTKAHLDNITNFAEGTLEDKVP
jgi:prepilin-type N-terminal cleavage/methylation domain-containing protein